MANFFLLICLPSFFIPAIFFTDPKRNMPSKKLIIKLTETKRGHNYNLAKAILNGLLASLLKQILHSLLLFLSSQILKKYADKLLFF